MDKSCLLTPYIIKNEWQLVLQNAGIEVEHHDASIQWGTKDEHRLELRNGRILQSIAIQSSDLAMSLDDFSRCILVRCLKPYHG